MHIVWATSEAQPYAKTGGLADVSAALPLALSERGHTVSVFMPFYPQVMAKLKLTLPIRYEMLPVPMGWGTEWAQVLEHRISDTLSFFFIEYHRFFDRPTLYDWHGIEFSDNAERYIFLSRAVMQAVVALGMRPDILHANDWHTALCDVYLKSHIYQQYENFANCRGILTLHNIGYQGGFDKSNMFWTGLGWDYFNHTCLEFFDRLSLLKGGIMTSDMVNTVSPTYAQEILTPGFSFSLEGPLRHVRGRGRLRGILNGIDVQEWNPETDHHLPAKFSKKNLVGKRRCKSALQEKLALPSAPDVPLFGVVSRLAYQKGIDVFADAAWDLLKNDDVQFAVLGTGEKWLHNRLSELAQLYPEKFAVYIGYSDKFSHLIEAGSDFFVMPSRYEPCGLNQMYSMRYGTAPVVRATGGLADTVTNFDPATLNESTGFKFYDLTAAALRDTMRWAASIYETNPKAFRQVVINGMSKDFSWNHTAIEYEQMYAEAQNA